MVRVLAHPGSSTQNTGSAPGALVSHPASHPASLPYEEWNAAPPERGVVGRGGGGESHQWLLSPASAAPPAVRLKELVEMGEPTAIFNFL